MKQKSGFFTTIILFVLLATNIIAQRPGRSGRQFDPSQLPKIGVLKGSVIDSSTQKPIPYASISLISQRTKEITTGGISNDQGKFHITEIQLGRYQVSIEFIGYKRVLMGPIQFSPRDGGIEQNLGEIILSPTYLQMQDIEVEGERPLFIQTAEKKIFNVAKNTVTTGGTVLDVLRQVPGVDVDIDGNISLRGSANVNVLIDGKPSSLTGGGRTALLDNIPADNVQDIEVITNPSVKYDPEGMAGIINIVLKENRLAGLNGSFNTGASGKGRFNGSSQVNMRNGKINVFANLGLRRNSRFRGGDTYRWSTFQDAITILDQETDGNRGGDNIFIKSGVEFFPDPSQSISLSFSFNDRKNDNTRRVDTKLTQDDLVQYYRTTQGDDQRESGDLTLSYDKKFGETKQKFSAYIHYSKGSREGINTYLTTALDGYQDQVNPNQQRTITNDKNGTTNIQVDYVHPFNKENKLEVGYKGTLRTVDNIYNTSNYVNDLSTYVINDSLSNHFLYNENIHAGYAQYSGKIQKLGFQFGGRIETVSTLSELKTTGETFKNPYVSFYPSISLSIGPPKIFQVQASYSRRVNRPSHRRLNPFASQSNSRNVRMGNPFLKPEYIDVMELNLSRFQRGFSVSLGSYYRRITDKFTYFRYVRDDGVSILTFKNSDEQKTYGLELILSGSIGKAFRVMLNGNIFQDEINASNLYDGEYNAKSTGYMGRFTTTWKVRKGTEFMFTGFYRGPRDIPLGKIGSMTFTSLSLKQSFINNRLSVSLRINDPFNTMGFNYKTKDLNYSQVSNRKWESRIATLTFEYRFGKMEDRSRFNRNRNRESRDGGEGFDAG